MTHAEIRILEAFPDLTPSAGHDYVDEVIGLLRVTRGQRDDAQEEIQRLHGVIAQLHGVIAQLEERLESARELIRHFGHTSTNDMSVIRKAEEWLIDAD